MKIDSITKSVAEAVSGIMDEGLKGDQHKIDANKNNKIDAQDFKLLRSKKKVEEESVQEANAPSVKVPTSTGMKVYGGAAGGSAKAYKDQHSDPFSSVRGPSSKELDDVEAEKKKVKKEETGYKNRLLALVAENQAFEQELNEVLSKDASASAWIHDFVHSDNPKFKGKSVKKRQKMALAAYYAKQRNEEVNTVEEGIEKPVKKVFSGMYNPAPKGTYAYDRAKEKQEKKSQKTVKEGKDPAMDAGAGSELPFAPPYNTSSSPAIKDKSGAVHTPMSRAKHLARTAMKKITKDLSNK